MSDTNNQKELVDIRNVHIDSSRPKEERIKSFIQQIKDPYNFKVGNVVVHISFSKSHNQKSINDNFVNMLSSI